MRFIAIVLFALLLPITANATTCTGATYLYSSSVPTGYTELEYIESNGTQYIDTDWIDTNKTAIDAKFYIIDSSSNYLYGSFQKAHLKYVHNGLYGADPTLEYNYIGYNGCSRTGLCVMSQEITGDMITIQTNDNIMTLNVGTAMNTPMYLLALPPQYDSPARIYPGRVRTYYFVIKDGSNIVRNLIPARRNSDNVVGMYDIVSGRFFTNDGTGTFVAGADVGTCAACPSNYTDVATYCPGDNQIHNCPTASYYASRVTRYGYWTSNGIHNTVDGCRAYITEQDPTGDYGLSCEIYNGDYGVDGSEGQCMADRVGWCAAGRYAPYDNPNTNLVWRQSVEAMVGEVCVDVGVGYYSPDGDLNRYECTNTKPANSHYSGSGGATNNCPFECDSGYGLYNGVCHARCPYGDGELHVGQYTHPLWADITNVPSPSVYIGELGPNHDGLCYAYLEPDDTPVDNHHGFHTVHNGVPYHAINLGLYGLE